MPYNESNEEFYDSLGPFAELKKEQKSSEKVNGELNQQFKLNGKQLTKDANYSSSNDSSSDSDDFSDTVDSLSVCIKLWFISTQIRNYILNQFKNLNNL